MNQPTILIISDEAEFARTVVNRWQSERSVPAFTVVSSTVTAAAVTAGHDVAIVGRVRWDVLGRVLRELAPAARPIIVVTKHSADLKRVRADFPRVLALSEYVAWPDSLVLVAGEALRRMEAVESAKRAEQKAAAYAKDAMLGRYMLEMRHTLNNALTSILGNAELILMEPGALNAQVLEQLRTIHDMSLRIHELAQRFSSLETELTLAETESQSETSAAGSHAVNM